MSPFERIVFVLAATILVMGCFVIISGVPLDGGETDTDPPATAHVDEPLVIYRTFKLGRHRVYDFMLIDGTRCVTIGENGIDCNFKQAWY